MLYPTNFFLLICTHNYYGILQQIQLCCPNDNFWQFLNLHKSKMKSAGHLYNFTLEPLVLELRMLCNTSFLGSKVRRIHLGCSFSNQGQIRGQM